jgi:hypothetical protein
MELRCNGCEATARQANSGHNVPSFVSLVPTRLTPFGATCGSLSQPLPRLGILSSILIMQSLLGRQFDEKML